MNGDAGLVGCLVDRLTSRLPHRTGAQGDSLGQDPVVTLTRTTLLKVSSTSLVLVLDSLLGLLEDLSRPYGRVLSTHPPHVLLSELYVLRLLAECCSSHWDAAVATQSRANTQQGSQGPHTLRPAADDNDDNDDDTHDGTWPDKELERMPLHRRRAKYRPVINLDTKFVWRIFDCIRLFLTPIPETYALPPQTILDDESMDPLKDLLSGHGSAGGSGFGSGGALGSSSGSSAVWGESPKTPMSSRSEDAFTSPQALDAYITEAESHVRTVLEYLTASCWPACFDHFKNSLYRTRVSMTSSGATLSTSSAAGTGAPASSSSSSSVMSGAAASASTGGTSAAAASSPQSQQQHGSGGYPAPITTGTLLAANEDHGGLLLLRAMPFFWVDRRGLTQLLQEVCANYLHFRRPFQTALATLTQLIITRWIERYPHEFVHMHINHTRLDGGLAATMFGMSNTGSDSSRRRYQMAPMQMALLFLVPDAFEVASNMREARTGGLVKKATFLENLRKQLRSRNEIAIQCHVSLLYVVRHFEGEADAAIVSYAMDIQNEVRGAIFRHGAPGGSGNASSSAANSSAGGGSDSSVFDQDLLTAAFVSLAYLNQNLYANTLVEECLAAAAPHSFKMAAIQACAYIARSKDAAKFVPLFSAASAFVQVQARAISSQLTAAYSAGSAPPLQRSTAINQQTAMLCNILSFLYAAPSTLFLGEPSNPDPAVLFFQNNFESFILCMIVAERSVRRLAYNVAPRLFADHIVLRHRRNYQLTPKFKKSFWRLTSLILSCLCDSVNNLDLENSLQSIHSYLESRLLLLKSVPELSELAEEIPERTACSTKLETLFLVSLCSIDIEICQLVTSCLGLFLEECRIIDTASKSAKSSSTLLRNGDVFREIASREFRFTGLVAFQRRVDGLLRKMQQPSLGILTAWEIAYDNWYRLAKDLAGAMPETVPEKTIIEWRNYSGFLASLAGICTASQCASLEEPAVSGLRWIDRQPPSALSPETQQQGGQHAEKPLLHRFLHFSVQLMGCVNVRVRETMREVLALETVQALYKPLFEALNEELDELFAATISASKNNISSVDPKSSTSSVSPSTHHSNLDGELAFAEQAVSLLRSVIERLDSPSDDLGAAWSVLLSGQSLNFAIFLESAAPDSISSLRVKIRTCQLCEAVTKRKEHLNVRDDVRIRNQLLEHIFSWIARPRSPNFNAGSGGGGAGGGGGSGRLDEAGRLQRDLDRACLRALAELTHRLPLQPMTNSEGQSEASINDQKSQMFHTYFNRFLSLLNLDNSEPGGGGAGSSIRHDFGGSIFRDEAATPSELAITILSNLLSSNLDVGLKRSLSIGFHENAEVRTAFVRVLCNILMQGTEFNSLTDAAVGEKYSELIDLITSDATLAVAMCAECPSSEIDELTMSLLNVFEGRGLGFVLLEALIKYEVAVTESESEILRRTSVATKIFSIYAKWKGGNYLRSTLQKVVERLMMTADDLDFELDPARVHSPSELQKNAVQLQIVAKVFIDDICASSSRIPAEFRKICHIISTVVTARFPDAKYTAVGAFIFLRFFCPAIVAPDVEGLVSTPPSKEMRRGLLLIAKIIQNLANNILFGAKEPYMFPLNEFLSQNIFDVTNFLRKISVPPDNVDWPAECDPVDFAASVALHRFLYDHWDQLRPRLVSEEQRREHVRSPTERPHTQNTPTPETLKTLITNLGPPPLTATWNKPQVTLNSPPAYSRFQNFMLRNAFQNTETFVSSRAIYDGGESKDGVSIICIILRNIDAESIDYDTLMYCYLKIASRLWHRPFGLFIDATCYSGQSEPQDELFQRLEMLSPTELSRKLKRVYIYNMNSAFRKCFRRILRMAAKAEGGVFHPDNVDYYLLSSMQELQAHFHMMQLHLPKETISVVTDTRYVYQQVTRLSRSRGEIEVVIKIGSQFVQITTTEKQEVHQGFGLDAIFNDIFRLSDIEQAPLSIHTEDDSAFGLRADNGKIIMYFASPKKSDILKEIRGAKAKYGKDGRAIKSYNRLTRPQDVPGTLLNISLASLASSDHSLRISAYNLLGALCRSFKYTAASELLCVKDIYVPLDPSLFTIRISKHLAQTEPHLTIDFLMAFFLNWDGFPEEQKSLSLAYMAPWLPGLRTTVLASETDSEKARENIAMFCRKLVEIATSDPFLKFTLEQNVWPSIYQDETLLDILLEEVVKMGTSFGIHDEHTESLASILVGISTITLRGKVISRLRKALNRSSGRPTRYLPDNGVWPEICVLLQFCVSLSFNSGVQAQMYLPEIFHVVTMLANTGSAGPRFLVHRLLTNSIHSMCTSFSLDEPRHAKLRGALETLSESKSELFTSQSNSSAAYLQRDGASISTNQEAGLTLAATESLATILFEMCSVAAPSVDTANVWRARWMSLVASTAFQNNPAIQPRAFTVMGCLAREEVDDDLLYQVLVALQTSIGRFGSDDQNNRDMTVAIVAALSKMLGKLAATSRYGIQLFWLAMALLRLVPPSLFNGTALFLEAVLANIGMSGEIRGDRMVPYLLTGRAQLEDAALMLDDMYGIHFNSDNFHFAVCACLVRGLTDTTTRPTTLRLLSTFLELTSGYANPRSSDNSGFMDLPDRYSGGGSSSRYGRGGPRSQEAHDAWIADLSSSPYMALIVARVTTATELQDSLWHLGIGKMAGWGSMLSIPGSPGSPRSTGSGGSPGDASGSSSSSLADQIRPAGAGAVAGSSSAVLSGSGPGTGRSQQMMAGGSKTASSQLPSLDNVHALQDVSAMREKDLLLNTAMELVDFQCLEDSIQHRTLVWLNELAREKPNVIMHLCAPIASILDEVLLHCQNSSTLDAAHELLQTLSSNTRFSSMLDSTDLLKATLDDMGFGGLWRSCSSNNTHEQDERCFTLTERLIVLTIAYS